MPSVTCKSPINIALIKYWGKKDTKLHIPYNSSLSITLTQDKIFTISELTSDESVSEDILIVNGVEDKSERFHLVLVKAREMAEMTKIMERMRDTKSPLRIPADPKNKLRIESKNNFPSSAGLASSASGYSCLVYCLIMAFHLDAYFHMSQLSILARLGSGSACRSMFPGFVEWDKGSDFVEGRFFNSSSVARPVKASPDFKLSIFAIELSNKPKLKSSRQGMQESVTTSTLYSHRVDHVVPDRINRMKKAILENDFETFAVLTMKDSNQFHAICLDTFPPISYLNDASHQIIYLVSLFNNFHKAALVAYSFDAGPNPFLFMREGTESHFIPYLLAFLTLDEEFEINGKTNDSLISQVNISEKIKAQRILSFKIGDMGPECISFLE